MWSTMVWYSILCYSIGVQRSCSTCTTGDPGGMGSRRWATEEAPSTEALVCLSFFHTRQERATFGARKAPGEKTNHVEVCLR